MKVEIRKNRYGYNGYCRLCGKEQDGRKPQPLVVYYIEENEKRGHNLPVCSKECAEKLVENKRRMSMKKAELIVIWSDGTRDVYEHQSVDEAKQGMENMKMAFGNQISWCGVVDKRR